MIWKSGERGSGFGLIGFGIYLTLLIIIIGDLYWIVSMLMRKG